MENLDKFSDEDWEKFSVWLNGMLSISEVTVTFTKKDMTTRVMRCTLQPNLIPKLLVTEDKPSRKKSETSITVYDLEAAAWRSFITRSVTAISITI